MHSPPEPATNFGALFTVNVKGTRDRRSCGGKLAAAGSEPRVELGFWSIGCDGVFGEFFAGAGLILGRGEHEGAAIRVVNDHVGGGIAGSRLTEGAHIVQAAEGQEGRFCGGGGDAIGKHGDRDLKLAAGRGGGGAAAGDGVAVNDNVRGPHAANEGQRGAVGQQRAEPRVHGPHVATIVAA